MKKRKNCPKVVGERIHTSAPVDAFISWESWSGSIQCEGKAVVSKDVEWREVFRNFSVGWNTPESDTLGSKGVIGAANRGIFFLVEHPFFFMMRKSILGFHMTPPLSISEISSRWWKMLTIWRILEPFLVISKFPFWSRFLHVCRCYNPRIL